jgi:mono/diheme cytochrome c family protein
MFKIEAIVILGLLIMLSLTTCIKSNQPTGPGSNFCDTTSVTYTNNVLPILQDYCFSCHGNGNTAFSNGVNLDGYDNVKGWAQLEYLVGDIRHDKGYTGMPYGKPKLSDCEINTIVAWVNQGEQK